MCASVYSCLSCWNTYFFESLIVFSTVNPPCRYCLAIHDRLKSGFAMGLHTIAKMLWKLQLDARASCKRSSKTIKAELICSGTWIPLTQKKTRSETTLTSSKVQFSNTQRLVANLRHGSKLAKDKIIPHNGDNQAEKIYKSI